MSQKSMNKTPEAGMLVTGSKGYRPHLIGVVIERFEYKICKVLWSDLKFFWVSNGDIEHVI